MWTLLTLWNVHNHDPRLTYNTTMQRLMLMDLDLETCLEEMLPNNITARLVLLDHET